MNVKLLVDLIEDEYHNYYVATKVGDKEITLVNYFIERSFSLAIQSAIEENIKSGDKHPESRYLGEYPMKALKCHVQDIQSGIDKIAKIIPMSEILKEFIVKVEPFYEKNHIFQG